MKTLQDLKQDLLTDPATRAEYNALADEYAAARELIAGGEKHPSPRDLQADISPASIPKQVH